MSLASQFFRRGGQALCRPRPSATSGSSTLATAPAYSQSPPLRSDLHAPKPKTLCRLQKLDCGRHCCRLVDDQ